MTWKTLSKEEVLRVAFISIDKEVCELPDGRKMPGYYTLHFPDWVNIVALDKQGRFVMIKQYRHATKSIHWEIPGGGAHSNEDLKLSALRELREETGYATALEKIHHVATSFPNPALQDNRVHTYLALDCERVGEQELDPFEDIEVVMMDKSEVLEMLYSGKIDHTIVVAALYQGLRALPSEQRTSDLSSIER